MTAVWIDAEPSLNDAELRDASTAGSLLALGMQAPAEVYALSALPVQKPLGQYTGSYC